MERRTIGQDKYSTEIVIQGYNSSLTMLGGGNSGGGIANDSSQSSNNNEEYLKYQMIWMMKFLLIFMQKLKFLKKKYKINFYA